MNYAKTPCDECPWRRDVPPGKFPPQRFIALASTAYDLAMTIFACHRSKVGHEIVCAGYLMQQSAHNLRLRLSRQSFDDVSSPVALFDDYREMAVANGVDPTHRALDQCREDGQR
jgi:Family of unknown function (DUF6283)